MRSPQQAPPSAWRVYLGAAVGAFVSAQIAAAAIWVITGYAYFSLAVGISVIITIFTFLQIRAARRRELRNA